MVRPGSTQEQSALKTCVDSIQRYQIPNERVFIVVNSDVVKPTVLAQVSLVQLHEQLVNVFPKGSSLRIDTTLIPAREAELFTIGAISRKVWSQSSALLIDNERVMIGYFDKGPTRFAKSFVVIMRRSVSTPLRRRLTRSNLIVPMHLAAKPNG
jgi:hypothetical protein